MDKRTQEIKALKKQMQAIADQIQELTEEGSDDLEDQVMDYVQQARDHWEDVSGQVHDAFSTAKNRTRKVISRADDFAHDNPWTAIAAAAAVGVLVGLFLSGTSGD